MIAGELCAHLPSTRGSDGRQDGQQAAAFAELAVASIAAVRGGHGESPRSLKAVVESPVPGEILSVTDACHAHPINTP